MLPLHTKRDTCILMSLRWHGCWAIHPLEGSAEPTVSDNNEHGDGGGSCDNVPLKKVNDGGPTYQLAKGIPLVKFLSLSRPLAWTSAYTAPRRFLVVLLLFVSFVCIRKLREDVHRYRLECLLNGLMAPNWGVIATNSLNWQTKSNGCIY